MACWAISSVFVILLALFQLCIVVKSVTVEVEQGWLRGETKPTYTGGQYYSFKGIPYAAPPLGELRFKAPQPALKWTGVRNATEHCSICTQPASYSDRMKVIGNENCLCVNVYTPNLKPDCPMPVMFFIHGGIYVTGSGNSDQYGPRFLMSHDVVLVTINYRLGAFGFIAIDTEEVPGNAGMKDTVAALQWVQKNIMQFGGDPDYVTIFGQSAGAAIVGLHVIAPSTKNLFKRAIIMSGSFINDWSLEFKPKRRAFAQGRVLGLDTKDPYELTRFLQSVPARDLIQIRPNFLLSDKISNDIYLTSYYTPNIEKKFNCTEGQYLTTRPTELMCKGQINQVDVMVGHTVSEGSLTTARMEETFLEYYPKYNELLVPAKIRLFRSPKKVLELANRVKSFYFGNQTISSRETILEVIKFNSNFVYAFDMHVYLERLPKLPNSHLYCYMFGLYSSRNVYGEMAEKYGIKEATHRDDLAYLFDGSFYNQTIDVNSKVFEYIQLICKLYTNYAKYGTPTPDDSLGFKWPDYDPDRRYGFIGRNGTLSSQIISYDNPILVFWRDIYKSVGIDIM